MRAQVYWIAGPWAGRLAIVPRPRGGDWLEDEVQAWKDANIGKVVSALQADELDELAIGREAELCKAVGIDLVAFPIADRGVPSSVRATVEALRPLERELSQGQTVAVHCRQGVGRSALLAACLLVLAGVTVDDAFNRIQAARGCGVPDTPEQRQWVVKFARETLAPAS